MTYFFFVFFLSLLGYLAGSIPSAVLLSNIMGFADPRYTGSNNPGATNVLRIAGKVPALLVLLLDALKGFLPVLLFKYIGFMHRDIAWVGLGAVLGHMYPVFLRFKGGGKGVATTLGVLFAVSHVLGGLVGITWLGIAFVGHYSSLASMLAISMAPFYSLFVFGDIRLFIPLGVIAGLILYQHRWNLTRLMEGEEPRIDFWKR